MHFTDRHKNFVLSEFEPLSLKKNIESLEDLFQ